MKDEKNLEIEFKEYLNDLKDSFGKGSQEGVKIAIRECQEVFGLVSKGHQNDIAKAFELDENMISAIIKFMPSIKESNIEYDIVCCTGSRCGKNGSYEVLETVKSILGLDFNETSKDGKIRLKNQNCFKKCKLGPNIMINGKFYHQMNKEKTKKLLKEIIK